MYVSAQIVSANGGSVTATIKKNGSPYKTATSSRFATIATVSGSF